MRDNKYEVIKAHSGQLVGDIIYLPSEIGAKRQKMGLVRLLEDYSSQIVDVKRNEDGEIEFYNRNSGETVIKVSNDGVEGETIDNIVEDIEENKAATANQSEIIGDVEELSTTEKSIVGAVNEVKAATTNLQVNTENLQSDVENMFTTSNNLYNPKTRKYGYIVNNTGVETVSTNFCISDFIPVAQVPTYYTFYGLNQTTYKGVGHIVLYDENKSFLARQTYYDPALMTQAVINASCKYVRFNIGINSTDVMIISDTEAKTYTKLPYIPYNIIKSPLITTAAEEKALEVQRKVFENDFENPLQTLLKDGGLCGIFKTIGVVGDSLSSGCMEYKDAEGNPVGYDRYEYSWIQHIAKMCGSTAYNFSVGGLKAETFWTTTNAKVRELRETGADHKCDAYFIALGVNDVADTDLEVGTSADIANETSTTFYGYYSRIIKLIQTTQPRAKIFIIGLPNHDSMTVWGSRFTNFRNAIADMVNHFDNCYYLDLFAYDVPYEGDFKDIYFNGFHMNASGYLRTAWVISTYVDWYIRKNHTEFREAGLIGTDYYYYPTT